MCGKYVTVSKVEYVEKKYNAQFTYSFTPNYNVSVGQLAPVITSEKPRHIQPYCFGYSPNWGDKRMYVINARSEGDKNKENDPNYTGSLGIINKPMWKAAIRNKRCVVIADAFIEGPAREKLKKPYLVFLRDTRAFAMAGIYNDWVNKDTGEVVGTFAIVTTYANKLMGKIGHPRSPVILHNSQWHKWLQGKHLNDLLYMLKPYESSLMNAFPISPEIRSPQNNGAEFIQPIGPRVFKEFERKETEVIQRSGFGDSPARRRSREEKDPEYWEFLEKQEKIQNEMDSQRDDDDDFKDF